MQRRTSIIHQMVETDDSSYVALYDAEWYGHRILYFDDPAKTKQCYKNTVAILTESYTKLTEAGWNQAEDWPVEAPEEVSYG